MGVSVRIYIVRDDNSIQRFPLNRYERLMHGDPNERLPEFADKRIRYTQVILDLVNRKPTEILRAIFAYMQFDAEGRIDSTYLEKRSRLNIDSIPPIQLFSDSENVINANHHFAQKRLYHQYEWKPTQDIILGLYNAIFTET